MVTLSLFQLSTVNFTKRAIDVLEAAQKMMNTLIYLIDRGEIIDRYEYLVPFYDMFGVDVEKEQNKNKMSNSRLFVLSCIINHKAGRQ